MLNKGSGCVGCRGTHAIPLFTMAFQPVVDLEEYKIEAHEALVRGPAGEGAASILADVTKENLYAFDQACRVKAIDLAARLGVDTQLNINFLPNAVYQPAACIRATLEAAKRTGFPLDRMTFEIVELEEMADIGHLRRIIAEYRRIGFKVALDDFSTGYSGLSRLAELKPDIIKIDRVLVRNCHLDRIRLAIAASVIALGAEIGIKVVIEGVETIEEVHALRAVGARFMQGFYFSRPIFEGIAAANSIAWPIGRRPVPSAIAPLNRLNWPAAAAGELQRS
jgi:EAL domain-containing protein (putative c-di-GMP-specific phosphodiesterase class I)